jgi:photosynthetic reaction center cytochrome c subunit
MNLGSRTILALVTTVCTWVFAVALVSGQAAPAAQGAPQTPPAAAAAGAQRGQLAEQVFKNVQVLRGTTVQEFIGAMGAFSAALGMSCEDCHAADDRNWDGFAAENPRKQMARRMVLMMQAINRANFAGRQMVTCYSCHRGSDRPMVTPKLSEVYGGFPPDNPLDIIAQAPDAPMPDAVFDKYLQAVGGAQRAAALKSFTAKGTRIGYGPESFPVPVEIYAVAPDRSATIIRTLSGDSTTAIDGTTAWYAAPYRPVPVLQLTGQDFDGARLDAMLAFPANIKAVASKWRVGRPAFADGKELTQVQGTTASGVTVSLFFDPESGLLVRQLRLSESPVGRIPTQLDYDDYREVAGVKLPFKIEMLGINGRERFELQAVQPNTAVPATRFGRPAPPVAPRAPASAAR